MKEKYDSSNSINCTDLENFFNLFDTDIKKTLFIIHSLILLTL